MTQSIGRGGTIALDAYYSDGTGTAVDPTSPTLDVLDPAGSVVVSAAVPTKVSLGHFRYSHTVDIAATLGLWTQRSYGLVNTVQVGPVDVLFEVVAAGGISGSSGLDLLTLAEAYTAVNDPTNAQAAADGAEGTRDTEMGQWVTAISQRIDDICGPVVSRAVSDVFDGTPSVATLYPRQTPVYSITSLTEYASTTATVLTAETNAAKQADGYQVGGYGGHHVKVLRMTSGAPAYFAGGYRNIELEYQAGRFANTAAVSAKFKEAAASILRRLWSREASAWSRGGDPFAEGGAPSGFFRAVDPMVAEFLADEILPPAVA